MKYIYTLATFVCVLSAFTANAQLSIGTQVVIYDGVAGFSEQINNATGASFVGMYSIPNSQFAVGLDFGSACYYMNKETRTLDAEGYPDVTASVKEDDGFYTFSLFGRFNMLKPGMLNPYFEGRAGVNTFYHSAEYMNMTTTQVNGELPEDLHCQFDINGTAFYSGLGAGLRWDISKLFSNWQRMPISLDASFNYNFGGKTKYYGQGYNEVDPQPKQERTLLEGNTHNYSTRIGLSVMFK